MTSLSLALSFMHLSISWIVGISRINSCVERDFFLFTNKRKQNCTASKPNLLLVLLLGGLIVLLILLVVVYNIAIEREVTRKRQKWVFPWKVETKHRKRTHAPCGGWGKKVSSKILGLGPIHVQVLTGSLRAEKTSEQLKKKWQGKKKRGNCNLPKSTEPSSSDSSSKSPSSPPFMYKLDLHQFTRALGVSCQQ